MIMSIQSRQIWNNDQFLKFPFPLLLEYMQYSLQKELTTYRRHNYFEDDLSISFSESAILLYSSI